MNILGSSHRFEKPSGLIELNYPNLFSPLDVIINKLSLKLINLSYMVNCDGIKLTFLLKYVWIENFN